VKKILTILISMFFLFTILLSCGGKNVKFESQNVESQTSKKMIKMNVYNSVNTDLKYFLYFVNSLNSKMLTSTELVPVKDENSELTAYVSINNFNETIVPNTNSTSVRIDLVASINLVTTNGDSIISNYSLTQTFITNLSYETVYDTFTKEEILDKIRYMAFNDLAINISSVISKGWRENYGAYTTTNSFMKSIIGGENATNTTKSKKRDIPTIGGE